MLDKYNETYEEIKVPKDLVNKTSIMMKHEQEKHMVKKKRFSKPMIFALCGSLVIVIAVAVVMLMPEDGGVILTALKDGDTVEKVELENGELKFSNNTVLGERDLQLGNIKSQKKGSLKDAEAFFEKGFKADAIPKGFKQEQEKVNIIYAGEEIKDVIVKLSYVNGKENLKITYANGEHVILTTNSRIQDTKLDISYTENTYTAIFKQGNAAYKVIGENMSQEEFILFLYKFLT